MRTFSSSLNFYAPQSPAEASATYPRHDASAQCTTSVVDTCTGDVQLLSGCRAPPRSASRRGSPWHRPIVFTFSIFIAGPGRHRIRIRIVQHDRTRLCHLADILAEIKKLLMTRVHDTARAKRIANALVHTILQRNLILLKAPQVHRSDTVYDITRIFKCLSAICSHSTVTESHSHPDPAGRARASAPDSSH